jgi:hypothetical protein
VLCNHHCRLQLQVTENKTCVLIFSTTFVRNIIVRRTERDIIIYVPRSSCKVPVVLSHFTESWIFSTDFGKILKHKVSWKSVQREPSWSMRADGQTDQHDEAIVAFRNFANAPKTEACLCNCGWMTNYQLHNTNISPCLRVLKWIYKIHILAFARFAYVQRTRQLSINPLAIKAVVVKIFFNGSTAPWGPRPPHFSRLHDHTL